MIARGSAGDNAEKRCSEDDLRLIARVREGDLEAFEALYRAHYPLMARYLAKLVRRPTLVEEVINDTMMVVWEKAGSFNGASRLSTWMFAIAYRKAMRALSRQDEAVEDRGIEERAALGPTPEEDMAQLRAGSLLARAMDSLSEDHRTVVRLTYFDELDYREIARVMDCPVDTVKTRMFHARRNLRRILGGDAVDWV